MDQVGIGEHGLAPYATVTTPVQSHKINSMEAMCNYYVRLIDTKNYNLVFFSIKLFILLALKN